MVKSSDKVLQLIRELCDRISCGRWWKDIFRVLLKQWILSKFYATGYTVGPFVMRPGTGCGEICHTPPSLS